LWKDRTRCFRKGKCKNEQALLEQKFRCRQFNRALKSLIATRARRVIFVFTSRRHL
jgi:hypothetical protein